MNAQFWKSKKPLVQKEFEAAFVKSLANPAGLVSPVEALRKLEWDTDKGEYVDLTIQTMWAGYKLCANREKEYNGAKASHYVIARANDNGRPTFTETPFNHKSYELGYAELSRLAHKHPGKKFILYHSLTAIRLESDVVPEPMPEHGLDIYRLDVPVYMASGAEESRQNVISTLTGSLSYMQDNAELHTFVDTENIACRRIHDTSNFAFQVQELMSQVDDEDVEEEA